MVSIPGGLWLPRYQNFGNSVMTYGSMLIDNTLEKAAFIVIVPKSGTLDKFEFRLGTVTQAPTNGLTCSFQDLTAGDPDGTQDQFKVVTAGLTTSTWVAPGLMTSDGTDTGVKRVVTAGDILACVIEYTSFSASDSLNVSNINMQAVSDVTMQCYSDLFTASWAKSVLLPVMALKYNDGTYGSFAGAVIPASATAATATNTGTTPDETGNRFTLPFSCEVSGIWYRADIDNAVSIVIYDSADTVMSTTVVAVAHRITTGNGGGYVTLATPVTFAANQTYRVVLKPTTGSSITNADMSVSTAAIMDTLDGGQLIYHTHRTDAGAWTDTTTKRDFIGLIITGLTGGGAWLRRR